MWASHRRTENQHQGGVHGGGDPEKDRPLTNATGTTTGTTGGTTGGAVPGTAVPGATTGVSNGDRVANAPV